MNWYEEIIDPGIRNEVKLLRDNGFNTIYSCAQEKCIQCEYYLDAGLEKLDWLLYINGYRNYEIEAHVERIQGKLHSFVEVTFHERLLPSKCP